MIGDLAIVLGLLGLFGGALISADTVIGWFERRARRRRLERLALSRPIVSEPPSAVRVVPRRPFDWQRDG